MKKLILEFWAKLKIWLQREAGIKDARLLLGVVIGMFVVVLMTTLSARISELNRMEIRRAELTAEVSASAGNAGGITNPGGVCRLGCGCGGLGAQ